LAKAAQAAGYDVSVATGNGSTHPVISSCGFNTIDIPIKRGTSSLAAELKVFLSIIRLFHQTRFDCVHAITLKTTLWAGLASRIAGQPNMIFALTGLGYLFTETGILFNLFRLAFVPFLYVAMNGKNARSIFQNPDDMELFQHLHIIGKNHGVVIRGSGVDPDYYTPVIQPPEPVTVMFAARLLGHKGLNEYVAAAARLKEKRIPARFAVVGDFDKNNPSHIDEEQIRTWERNGLIEYLGHFKDIREAYKQCHIVCLPSYREGLPKSLIEAASCGLPIVTTDIPGCREIVRDGINGFLVPVKTVEPLADAIETLIANADMRTDMGIKGRKLIEDELSIEHVKRMTINLYNELS